MLLGGVTETSLFSRHILPLPRPPQALGCMWGNHSLWKTGWKILDVLSDRVKPMTHSLTVHRGVVNRHSQGRTLLQTAKVSL